MRKILSTVIAAAVVLPTAAQAGGLFHKERDRAASAESRTTPARVWTPGTEVRNWHGRQVVVLPPWQSEQAALGREDTSGHVP